MLDWDDMRYLLAVGRQGGLTGAARILGVNHSTVFRRIATLEGRIGTHLFERRRGGYTPTPAGEDMIDVAARIEDEIAALDRRVGGGDVRLSGTVRVTAPDTLAQDFLCRHIALFRDRYPDIAVELVVGNAMFNLSRREADIAIRPTLEPRGNLVGRRLADIAFAVYGSEGYLRGRAAPVAPADLAGHALIAGDDSLSGVNAVRWMARHAPRDAIVMRSNSLTTIAAAVRAGIGLATLPCFMADPDPDLRRVLPPVPDMAGKLWLLTHPDLRHAARIRAFTDSMAETIARDRPLLEGQR